MARNRRNPVGFSHIDYYQNKERELQEAINKLAQQGEQILNAEAGPRMMSANPLVSSSSLQATIAPQTPLNKFEPYLRGLEAGPQMMEPGRSNTGLRPTIAPATPKQRFQPLLNEIARLNTLRRKGLITDKVLNPIEGMITQQGKEWPRLAGMVPVAGEKEGVRHHMDYERGLHGQAQYNAITGKLEPLPIMDPENPLQPLTTPTGRVQSLPGGHDRASELIAQRALQLAGQRVVINNNTMVPTYHGQRRAFERTDLINTDTDTNIDAQVRWTDAKPYGLDGAMHLPMQAYTTIAADRTANQQRSIIAERMMRDNVDVITAVEGLITDKIVMPGDPRNPDRRKGKLMKQMSEFTPNRDDQFDEILMIGMEEDRARAMNAADTAMQTRNNRGSEFNIQLPDTIDLIDLEKVNRYLKAKKKELKNNVLVNNNRGNSTDGLNRHQVNVMIPRDATIKGDALSINMISEHPLLQQLLAVQPIIR